MAGVGSGQQGGSSGSGEGGAQSQARGAPPSAEQSDGAQTALHEAFAKRGCDTLLRLGKKFKSADDDDSKGLSYEEVRSHVRLPQIVAEPCQL